MLDKITWKHRADNYSSDRIGRMYNFLRSKPVGVLSTVGPDGDPHGVVIYFGVDTSLNITFLTRTGTRKYDDLLHNDHTMLTVFDPKTQTTMQLSGVAEEITDNEAINTVAAGTLGASLRTSEAGIPPISKLEAGEYTAFQITPVQGRMAVYARPDPGDYSELFESVESFELHS